MIIKRVPIQLHNNTLASLRYYLSIANQYFDTIFEEPKLSYHNKGSIAGSALLHQWQIQLNTNMLLENKDQFINQVIPHELAHLIVYKKFGRVKPHGKEWQLVMTEVFKQEARRTHNFNLPQTIMKARYHYSCACQTHLLTQIRHQKIQRNQAQYYCKSCGKLLKQFVN